MRSALFALPFAGLGVACQPSKGPTEASAPASAEHVLLGEPAPAFELSAVVGDEALTSGGLEGTVVLLDFWASWCAPCKDSFPVYEALQAEYGDKIRVVAVAQDEDPGAVQPFMEQNGGSFFVAWDEGQALGAAYNLQAMPTLFVLDRNGLIRHVHEGFHPGDDDALRGVIDSLL